jgi:hypothetical protein
MQYRTTKSNQAARKNRQKSKGLNKKFLTASRVFAIFDFAFPEKLVFQNIL